MLHVPGTKGLLPVAQSEMVRSLAGVTPAQIRLLDAAADIALNPPTKDDACYLHGILCQVGMPRKRVNASKFERTSGSASLLFTAGDCFDGHRWIPQPLPYGAKPRLIFINLTTAAVQKKSRIVDVGRSAREFMVKTGIDPAGVEYRRLRVQVNALAACHISLGWREQGAGRNKPSISPFKTFDVWLSREPDQRKLWPQTVELTQEYYDSLLEHAVPLDERAVSVLRGSALALDIYTWLAHRLPRAEERGVPIRWEALKAQFGQEYKRINQFRAEFRDALRQVLSVYPDARVTEEPPHGIRLRSSPPPIPKIQSFLS